MLPEIGEEGQRKLSQASVAIVGAGGLGSAVATYLAGAGVGHILIIDPDTVSLSNLQRQVLYSESQLNQPKAECAAARLQGFNSSISVEPHACALTAGNARKLLQGCTLVVDCTDNFEARYTIDDVCFELGLPWIYGSIGEFAGQVSVMNYRAGTRYSDFYPDREELCALPRTTKGVIGAVPGVIGSIEACEAIKLISGCGQPLDGRLFTIDLLNMSSDIINFH